VKKIGIIAGIVGITLIVIAIAMTRGIPSISPPVSDTFEPVTFTGSSDKTTSPFTVTTREWIIAWSYVPDPEYDGVFAFYVYPRGETAMFVEAIVADGDTVGTTYSYAGKGEYYIKVFCLFVQHWEITISPA